MDAVNKYFIFMRLWCWFFRFKGLCYFCIYFWCTFIEFFHSARKCYRLHTLR